jgi:predicted transposase YdaD
MAETKTSHDQLFKQLLGEFFPEFIELFFPQMAAYLDRDSIEFLPLELFTDLVSGDAFETDLIVKVRFRGQASYFIIHIEHQGKFGKGFDKRVFNYFALIHRDYDLPVYPIVIFSHRSPKVGGDRSYTVAFPDWEVLRFNYRAIRLNHLAWQDFVGKANPVASAFMSKMKIRKQDRLLVKFECLRELAELNLNPAQLHLLLGFVDTYLGLEASENTRLLEQLDRIEGKQKEGIMQIVTSWERQGIAKGEEKGRQEGRQEAAKLLMRQLTRKLGEVSKVLVGNVEGLSVEQMSDLGEALFDFESESDLRVWLSRVSE